MRAVEQGRNTIEYQVLLFFILYILHIVFVYLISMFYVFLKCNKVIFFCQFKVILQERL